MSARKVFVALLLALVAIGLVSGLLYALNFNLNSDTVVPGLVVKEIVARHNFQFYFPQNDPYLFTDIYTFYLFTQAVSGYNPVVLRLTAFLIFLLVVGVYSYIIKQYAGTINALLFAALITNLSPGAYDNFIAPEVHVGTLLATGLLIYLFDFEKIKKASRAYVLAICVIAGLVALSDKIFVVFFVLPYVICYVLRSRAKAPDPVKGKGKKEVLQESRLRQQENVRIGKIIVLLLAFVALSWIVTLLLGENCGIDVPNFVGTSISVVSINKALTTNLPLFVNSLALLLNGNLFAVMSPGFSLFDLAMAGVFLVVLLLAFAIMGKGGLLAGMDRKARYLLSIGIISAALMFLLFVFTDQASDLASARYLIFLALFVFVVIALAGRFDGRIGPDLNTLFLAAVLVLLLSNVAANAIKIAGQDFQPNKDDYAFIDYMKSHNITYAFADYWTANKLMYLSDNAVTVMPARIEKNLVNAYPWLTTKEWFRTRNRNYFIIAKEDDLIYPGVVSFIHAHPPDGVFSYGAYSIYQYKSNDTSPAQWIS